MNPMCKRLGENWQHTAVLFRGMAPLPFAFSYYDNGAAAQAARSHCKGRGGRGVVWGPLRLPWGGVGPLAIARLLLLRYGDTLWLPWGGVGPLAWLTPNVSGREGGSRQ